MIKRSSLKSCVLATSSAAVLGVAIAAAFGSPALAQDDDEDAAEDRVTVTGSRIQRQDFTANSPIVTVDSDTFENTSTIGLETILNQLPQFLPAAFTQFNTQAVEPNPFSTPGSSNVNLRGLGANRNLVLVDGRRATPINATNAVDTNSIPSSAVQRVEIISGGASAVYGADAVGGVVNFILKDDFEGLEVDTQYGLSELGDSAEFRISALAGANLANGRGNVMFGAEHSTRGEATSNDRGWFYDQLEDPNALFNAEFWFSETYYQPGFANGHPNAIFEGQPTQDAVDSIFDEVDPGLVGRDANFFINPTADGNGTVFTGGGLFIPIFGGTVPGAGAGTFGNDPDGAYKYAGPVYQDGYESGPIWRKTLPNGEILENQLANYLSTPLTRYSMFGRFNFDITDNITFFADGRFAKTESRTLLQYSPANNGWGVDIPYGTDIYAPSVDDFGNTLPAYLPGGAFDLNCPAVGGCTNSQAFPVPAELAVLLDARDGPNTIGIPAASSNSPWHLGRNLDFLPRRQTTNRSTNFQLTAGLEGELPNDWLWDVSLSHGQADGLIQSIGFASLAAYRAIASSPNYGRNFRRVENPGHGTFASGVGTCTSGLPLIQEFEVSQDCIDAISVNLQETSYFEQSNFQANLVGDLFDLPAGPIGFALGAEYRESEYEFRTDRQKSIGSFTDQTIGIFPAGSTVGRQDVREVYGELLVPIVQDLPFARAVNLELGGRYSDYNTIGGVETYKVLADWTITDWARLRGGYNRANRAPNIGEQFQARTTVAFGPAAAFGDPCNPNNLASPASVNPAANDDGASGAAHAKAICDALMGSQNAIDIFYLNPPTANENTGAAGATGQSVQVGSLDLKSEVADTFTAGLVLASPIDNPYLNGLRVTLDYFLIEIDDLISQKPIDNIYIECLDNQLNPNQDITTPACDAITRNAVDGSAQEIEVGYTNEGYLKLSGVDVQIDYSAQFADLGLGAIPGGFGMNMLATIPAEVEYRPSPAAPLEYGYIGTQSNPPQTQGQYYEYTMFTTFNYFNGPWSGSLRWQHYPSIRSGSCRTDSACVDTGPGSYNLFGLSGSYQLTEQLRLRAGVDNLFDKKPPLTGGNANAAAFPTVPTRNGGGTYDPIGRRFFIGANASF